jgi:hypothetical protein
MAIRFRSRIVYAALAVVTIFVGLAVHEYGAVLSPVARDVLGDALWAAMIAWWIGAAAPAVQLLRRAMVALAICFVVEFSQLHHAPGIDALRDTTLGHLVLGSGFDPRDLASYTAGVFAAALLDHLVVRLIAGRRRETER